MKDRLSVYFMFGMARLIFRDSEHRSSQSWVSSKVEYQELAVTH